MSLEIQAEVFSQARAEEAQAETHALQERMENLLCVLFAGLSAGIVSAVWVALSLG